MKRVYPIALLFAFAACGPSKNVQQADIVENAQWQKDSLVADGNDTDWSGTALLDEKLGISYYISNDQENLYVQLASRNDATIQRILRGGLTILVNGHGVKEEAGAAGIVFPTGNRVQKEGRLLNDRPELQQNKQVALDNVQDYSLFGFREVKTQANFDYGKRNPAGIELGIGLNESGAVVYEAAIPFTAFMSDAELRSTLRRMVAIGFVLDQVPEQQMQRRGGGGGVSIGGGLGFGSFGMGSGMGISIGTGSLGRIGGGNSRQARPAKFWRELQLARPPAPVK